MSRTRTRLASSTTLGGLFVVVSLVLLSLTPAASPDFVVNSAPLQGTLQLSTASAEVTFPPGFSRGFVRATWNPPAP